MGGSSWINHEILAFHRNFQQFSNQTPSKTHLIRSVSTATRWFPLALGPRGISHNGSRSPPHGRTSWCQRWQLNDAWRCPEFGAGQGPAGPIQCPMAVKNWGFTIWLWLTVCHGKSQFFIGKPSINGQFSMAMLNSQRVTKKNMEKMGFDLTCRKVDFTNKNGDSTWKKHVDFTNRNADLRSGSFLDKPHSHNPSRENETWSTRWGPPKLPSGKLT